MATPNTALPADLFPPQTNSGAAKPIAPVQPAPVDPAPILSGSSVSGAGTLPFPSAEPPTPSTPPAVNIDQPDAPGFGPEVPDTTTGITAGDSPGALFTAENIGAATDSLQPFADKAPGVTADQTVQGQLEKILNQDNALFDWARGQASQYANSRGLQNSDIAAEASAQAVLGVAMPIASQDAATFAQRATQEAQFWQTAGLQAFDATIQSTLMAQDHLQQLVSISHQGDVNSRLQLEQFGYNWNLSVQDNLHQMQQLALQGDINARLALQQFGFDVSLMETDFGFRVKLADIDLRNALQLSEQDHTQWLDRMAQDHVNNLAGIAAAGSEDRANIATQGGVDLANIAAGAAVDQANIAAGGAVDLANIAAGGVEDRANIAAGGAVDLANIEAGGAIDLANIAAGGEVDLANIEAGGVIDQANIAAGGEIDLANIAAGGDVDQANIEARAQADLDRDKEQFSFNLQQKYLDAVTVRNGQFSLEIRSIYQQEGLTSAQQNAAVAIARQNYENDLAFIAAQYSSNSYWDPSWIVSAMQTPDNPYPNQQPPPYDGPVGTNDPNPTLIPDPVNPQTGPAPSPGFVPEDFQLPVIPRGESRGAELDR